MNSLKWFLYINENFDFLFCYEILYKVWLLTENPYVQCAL